MSYETYNGRCIGRLLYFLNRYDFNNYERVVFAGGDKITLGEKPYATYTWDGNTDIPTFKFEQEHLNEIQRQRKSGIIQLPSFKVMIVPSTELKQEIELLERELTRFGILCGSTERLEEEKAILAMRVRFIRIQRESFWIY